MSESYNARIYYLHPLLAGPVTGWDAHLDHCASLGFDHLLMAPPFLPGNEAGNPGSLFNVADHDRVHPALRHSGDADSFLAGLAESCRTRGLSLMLDLTLDRVAGAGELARSRPSWFRWDAQALDPRRVSGEWSALLFNYGVSEAADTDIAQWWIQRILGWIDAGIGGFRCVGLQEVPAPVWRRVIAGVRECAAARFIAWTPGLAWQAAEKFAGCGFDALASSGRWWDFRAGWLAEEFDRYGREHALLTFPEAPFEPRRDGAQRETESRRALWFAAATGDSWLLPMGFEYGATEALQTAQGDPADLARWRRNAPFDLSNEIRVANKFMAAAGGARRALRPLTAGCGPVSAFLREAAGERLPLLILSNADSAQPQPVDLEAVQTSAGLGIASLLSLDGLPVFAPLTLAAGQTLLLFAQTADPVHQPAAARSRRALQAALKQPRIAIEGLQPLIDGGRFAVRRIVGDRVQVEADVFSDGHDLLAAELLWRVTDQRDWNVVPMCLGFVDRWSAVFTPVRVGGHEYAVRAWLDEFGSFQHGLEKKHAAGVDTMLELREGRDLLARAAAAAEGQARSAADAILKKLDEATPAQQLELLLSAEASQAVVAAGYRPFATETLPVPLEVERLAARYASWYELFPRSMSGSRDRHGRFDDVIGQLPRIRDMGFDVLYFPPIHPIGTRNRKGPNNTLTPQPGDPGSPYAIGSAEGGHDAIHPELGSFDDFRRLREAAAHQGLELALDFAIQCSPDHPWLTEHPGWFAWRPDGSMKYAENPPKKYQDIVNVDFYGEGAIPELWLALRDVVLGWVREGVKIFRIDNPHTKPLPFWEWMIADVRGRDPEVIFLAEAFTRPTMMYRLGKIGFSQSYTYFTWRNHKQEIQDYLTELNTAPVAEFYRPHFFVNTPDINPTFLQTSGRAGFLIRAALATMGSGLWGMYSGFELCEAAALPGKEEYLDSEKFELRPRDWNQPGNIAAEIAQLNRIRRLNPALHTHLGFRPYHCWNDQVLYFGKATPDLRNFILVAISLDPHHAQEADFELPLWEFGLADDAAIDGEDLMTGRRWRWQGKRQHLRIDPSHLPFGIWRLVPPGENS